MNRYEIKVLTPLLVGDGQKLAPIDYMVWKDQINVLDQRKIFRLLAKSSRLDGYLAQLSRADKLDFAQWGGYAQNYASRRIPLESPGLTQVYERARPEDLFIQTFAAAAGAMYLPATAIKGALRTAYVANRSTAAQWKEAAERLSGDRPTRRPAEPLESSVLGPGGSNRARGLLVDDAKPSGTPQTKVYLLLTSTLVDRGGKTMPGWKQGQRSVDANRMGDATPVLAEMAVPGTVFTGNWSQPARFTSPEVLKALRWREAPAMAEFTTAANDSAADQLAWHLQYAQAAGWSEVAASVEDLRQRLTALRESGDGCLLCIGWGTGMLPKSALLRGGQDEMKAVLKESPFYSSVVRTGLPFPKTRRIVFLNGRPAALPGWVELRLAR